MIGNAEIDGKVNDMENDEKFVLNHRKATLEVR
jgi:hypothetical protein